MKDRIPSVITSELGLKYLQEKEDKKRNLENQKALKKNIQLEKMKIKKEKDEEKERKKKLKQQQMKEKVESNKSKNAPAKKKRKIVTKI